jgi:hypothetical protein
MEERVVLLQLPFWCWLFACDHGECLQLHSFFALKLVNKVMNQNDYRLTNQLDIQGDCVDPFDSDKIVVKLASPKIALRCSW